VQVDGFGARPTYAAPPAVLLPPPFQQGSGGSPSLVAPRLGVNQSSLPPGVQQVRPVVVSSLGLPPGVQARPAPVHMMQSRPPVQIAAPTPAARVQQPPAAQPQPPSQQRRPAPAGPVEENFETRPDPALDMLRMQLSPPSAPPVFDGSTWSKWPSKPLQIKWEGTADAYLLAPQAPGPPEGLPLLICLHGCWAQRTKADEARCVQLYQRLADEGNVAVVVPFAQHHTWDFVMSQGQQSRDTQFLRTCIEESRRLLPIDPLRISLMGFSDGASFALSLAAANGDLFETALVWAAGFCLPAPPPATFIKPRPHIFMWHGTNDQIFDLKTVSWPVRDHLLRAGYLVHYYAEPGGRHVCPEPGSDFCDAALGFWLSKPARQ